MNKQTNSSPLVSATSTSSALQAVKSIPRRNNEPVFNAPWEAEVFALCLSLHEQGVFSWSEWASALSAAIHDAQHAGDPDLGNTYYEHWLTTLEQLLVNKGVADPAQLTNLYNAWDSAARNTEHGQPIELA